MYEDSACFDPTTMQEGLAEDGFSQSTHVQNCTSFPMEELSCHRNPPQYAVGLDPAAPTGVMAANIAAMEMELQQEMSIEKENCYNTSTTDHIDAHLMQDVGHDSGQVLLCDQSNWDTNVHEMQDMSFNQYPQQQDHLLQQVEIQNQNGHQQGLNYPPTPDLLNLFHLPRCSSSSLLPNGSISFANPTTGSTNFPISLSFLGDLTTTESTPGSNVLYDPLLPLNLPPQPPMFRELIQSLPHGYNLTGSRIGSLFDGMDGGDGSGGVYQEGDGRQFDGGVLKFSMNMKRKNGKDDKHFATERDRRVNFNDKYKALRSLVPNPTKVDRASVVSDAIDYIEELRRTVDELKILVEKKRCARERIKRHKAEDDEGDVESTIVNSHGDRDHASNGTSLRSSWLQRKSKNAEIDVRIIDDEVTIKVVQQKRINCLLSVSKILDELQLDLQHVAGGLIGDYYSFLFNTKIFEGSSVYARAIANKLIEIVDRQYAAVTPTVSC